jgi:hypothetical protein
MGALAILVLKFEGAGEAGPELIPICLHFTKTFFTMAVWQPWVVEEES